MRCYVVVLAAALAAGPAVAAEHHAPAAHDHQPYAGFADRAVKALSEDERQALLSGQGFSQALAAELNGFPGPLHVIELAAALELSEDQRSQVEALFRSMTAEATALGAEVVEEEAALDSAFASADIDEARLTEMTERIGVLRGRLRAVHLKYHLRTRDLLSPHQVASYNRLRGYVAAEGGHPHPHRH
jgi:Spy/CpxP family protein refolding chaperone